MNAYLIMIDQDGDISVKVPAPESSIKNHDLFFTNAILCLKEGEDKMQAPTLEE